MSRSWRIAIATVALAATPLDVHGQDSLVIRGHVVRQEVRGPVPVGGIGVTLHRIGPNAAGAVDSLRTDRSGEFVFRLVADSASMYLATARHAGIAYFAPPTRLGEAGGESEIVVFDTTTSAVPLRVSGRHLVVSAPNARGARELVEVFEIENDTIVTRVSRSREQPTFRTTVPAGSRNIRAVQGDFTGNSVVVDGATVSVLAPIAPGIRQLVLSYEVEPGVFPLALGVEAPAGVLEVLLEEAEGRVDGGTLTAQDPVTLEGRNFVRYLGRDVPAGAPVAIVVPDRPAGGAISGWVYGAALGLLSLVFVAWATRRRTPAVMSRDAPVPVPAERTDPSAWSVADLREAIVGVEQVLASPETRDAARPALEAYRRELEAALEHSLASTAGAP